MSLQPDRPHDAREEPEGGVLPTLFLSHGAPTLAVEPSPAREHLLALGRRLARPRAVLCVSAHWETPAPVVDASPHPRTLHDFRGFGPELQAWRYPVPGSLPLARRTVELLGEAGLEASATERGLDHGAWVPLSLLFPEAEVPVVQLSLQTALGPGHHLRLGGVLEPLRHEGVLIVGSGSATHDLRAVRWQGAGPPSAEVRAFDDWLVGAAQRGDVEALVDYRRLAPSAQRHHPTEEHFLPVLVALGAAGRGARGRALHRSMAYGSLSMTCLTFE